MTDPTLLTPESPPKSGRSRSVIIGMIVVVGVILFASLSGDDGDDLQETSAEGEASCPALSTTEIAQLVDSWTGNGTFIVEASTKTDTDGSETFTEIWYLQGSAPGIDSQVFPFATAPDGLLVGAESVSREFFDWGSAMGAGSPIDQEARAALAAAPSCLG